MLAMNYFFRINLISRQVKGFTLVELVVTLAVLALMLSIGIPSLKAAAQSIKLNAVTNSFVSHLYMARGEAIKRNSRVVVCKSADGQSCTSAGGWEQGWIVFHDLNNDGLRDAAEDVIARGQALPANFRLTGNLSVANYVSFASTGGTKLVGGGFQAGTLMLCNQSASGGEGRQIILNAVGRTRVQKIPAASCA